MTPIFSAMSPDGKDFDHFHFFSKDFDNCERFFSQPIFFKVQDETFRVFPPLQRVEKIAKRVFFLRCIFPIV